MMADLIDRQAAIDAVAEFLYYTSNFDGMRQGFDLSDWKWKMKGVLSDLPSAQPERKKGKWIYLNGLDAFECSVCGRQMVRNIFDYCPWCGAEMTKGEEDE